METLKNLNIDILPPTKIVARAFQIVDIDNEIYYAAEVSEFRDFWIEPVTVVFALSEDDLKKQLKRIYNCDHMMERTLKNFILWYENLTHKKLSKKDMKKIVDKFVD